MPNIYNCPIPATAVTVQVDLWEIVVPATKVVYIHEISLGQSSDVGDAQEEIIGIELRRGVGSTTGTGGTQAATPAKTETGDGTPGTTYDYLNTTLMTAGTITLIELKPWNVRGEFLYLPTPEKRPILAPSERLAVRLVAAPADSLTIFGNLTLEEVG